MGGGQTCFLYIALVLVDLGGVLHLRKHLHATETGFAFFSVELLLVELLQRRQQKLFFYFYSFKNG